MLNSKFVDSQINPDSDFTIIIIINVIWVYFVLSIFKSILNQILQP